MGVRVQFPSPATTADSGVATAEAPPTATSDEANEAPTEGWRCVPSASDARHATYYDPTGAPRVHAFIKAASYDPVSSARFLSEAEVAQQSCLEQRNLILAALLGRWSAATPVLVYMFRSGQRQYDEFISGTTRSEFDRHEALGFAATEAAAAGVTEALGVWMKRFPEDEWGSSHAHMQFRVCSLPSPGGLDHLDRFEFNHIAATLSPPIEAAKGPSWRPATPHVSLGD
jgi:hypothetical protein